MSSATIVQILLALLTVAVGVGTYLGAGRAGRLQASGTLADIDAKAYERAKMIYESAIDTLQEHVTGLREQMSVLDREVAKLQSTNRSLIIQVSELQDTNHSLTVQVRDLQDSNRQLLEELRRRDGGINAQGSTVS